MLEAETGSSRRDLTASLLAPAGAAEPTGPGASVDAVEEGRSRIELPGIPDDQRGLGVAAWSQPLVIDTYLPLEPDDYPAFLDTRVYQGSSGRVYPLPFHERIDPVKRPHTWQAVHLENAWVRIVVLPELGGRIHVGYDKVADYDFFYRNNVIKPALVGLAGPWISGGVEFNWPQHHRPATFLPTDWTIEREDDGSVTVWCSDHDPMARMKGMHGIRLRADSSLVEARVRLHNRTDDTHTFLWWANVAAAVNDDYQSFFPPDVHHVADHAKRAVATFPRVEGRYYGVDYPARVTPERPDGDRLDWYRNIPVPTSYMVTSTQEAFFGGYDHGRDAGFVHWADRAISPGKKQWTWGNAPFGWAWDANLTDADGPYVELMAGVYTDNQPDFSWITPGETKTFSQYWFPVHAIGPVHHATRDLALRLEVDAAAGRTAVRLGLAVTRPLSTVVVDLVDAGGGVVASWARDTLDPGAPLLADTTLDAPYAASDLTVRVTSGDVALVSWHAPTPGSPEEPPSATEPPDPADVGTVEELYLTGQYLAQYRHATRSPEPYWAEGLRRDPGDVRTNVAVATRLDADGRSAEAERHLRRAIERLVHRAPNPADGEALYVLGLCLLHQERPAEAAAAFGKASWNAAWRAPAAWQLARLAARAGDLGAAEAQLRTLRALDRDHLGGASLLVMVLRATGHDDEATRVLEEQRRRDPLDQWLRHLAGLELTTDAPTVLDVALDLAACGADDDALELLDRASHLAGATALGQVQVGPLVHYHRAVVLDRLGRHDEAAAARALARIVDGRHCLASRLADVTALQAALATDPADARAELLLGSWLYDRGRRDDAIAAWERAVAADPAPEVAVVAHRNLGVAAYNVRHDLAAAADHYAVARAVAPLDAKLLFESDQLKARRGIGVAERLALLEQQPDLVSSRDDLTVVLAGLLTQVGRAQEAVDQLLSRRFQPWEGGEGEVLRAWEDAMVALARHALADEDTERAVALVREALSPPESLGEGRHTLANVAELHWWLGCALDAAGQAEAAREAWVVAASFSGDFTGMSPQPFSVRTAWSVRALRALGREDEATRLLGDLAAYGEELATTPARLDYFATSLPAMLLFHDDPQVARDTLVATLREQVVDLEVRP